MIVISARAGVKERVVRCAESHRAVSIANMSGRFRTCRGKKIELRLVARRFVCSAPLCRRRIFAERFDDGVVAERSRRTSCLECVVHHLGLALGGRPAASIAKRLVVPVSNDTLLRSRAATPSPPLRHNRGRGHVRLFRSPDDR